MKQDKCIVPTGDQRTRMHASAAQLWSRQLKLKDSHAHMYTKSSQHTHMSG